MKGEAARARVRDEVGLSWGLATRQLKSEKQMKTTEKGPKTGFHSRFIKIGALRMQMCVAQVKLLRNFKSMKKAFGHPI